MADAYTNVAALNTSQIAYDRYMYFALRAKLFYDQVATVKPTNQAMPGTTTRFTFYDDLADQTAALNEVTDVEFVALSDSQTDVVLVEYGNAVATTAKLRGTTFAASFNSDVANIVARNAAQSQDSVCRTALYAGSNVAYIGQTSRAALVAGNIITSASIRTEVARLRAANVDTWDDKFFGAIHPDVGVDLRQETGAAAWLDPVNYSDAVRRFNGEIGTYEGVRWAETSRAPVYVDGGAAAVDAYATLILGKEALAKTYSEAVSADMPRVVIGPVTDRLNRIQPIGWYWLGGYARFREASIRRIESSSSIGVNV